MEINKLEKIKLSLMEATSDTNKKNKTNYLIRSSATIVVNELVAKTIEMHGIENVITAVYDELIEINKDKVDSIGMWVNYDGKTYENSIQLQTLNDMEKLGEDDVNSIYEFFKLMSHTKENKN